MSIRETYDRHLDELDVQITRMGEKVRQALAESVEHLRKMEPARAQEIQMQDNGVDAMEREIEHRCMTLLLRQQPVASDLRRVTAALKMVTDLERLGDHAADIAEVARHLEGESPVLAAVEEMAAAAQEMVRDSIDAFVAADCGRAARVIDRDDDIDARFDALKRRLAAHLAQEPAAVDDVLDWLMIVKYLERVGDHAVNIAEWTIYSDTGMYKNQRLV